MQTIPKYFGPQPAFEANPAQPVYSSSLPFFQNTDLYQHQTDQDSILSFKVFTLHSPLHTWGGEQRSIRGWSSEDPQAVTPRPRLGQPLQEPSQPPRHLSEAGAANFTLRIAPDLLQVQRHLAEKRPAHPDAFNPTRPDPDPQLHLPLGFLSPWDERCYLGHGWSMVAPSGRHRPVRVVLAGPPVLPPAGPVPLRAAPAPAPPVPPSAIPAQPLCHRCHAPNKQPPLHSLCHPSTCTPHTLPNALPDLLASHLFSWAAVLAPQRADMSNESLPHNLFFSDVCLCYQCTLILSLPLSDSTAAPTHSAVTNSQLKETETPSQSCHLCSPLFPATGAALLSVPSVNTLHSALENLRAKEQRRHRPLQRWLPTLPPSSVSSVWNPTAWLMGSESTIQSNPSTVSCQCEGLASPQVCVYVCACVCAGACEWWLVHRLLICTVKERKRERVLLGVLLAYF